MGILKLLFKLLKKGAEMIDDGDDGWDSLVTIVAIVCLCVMTCSLIK